MNGTMHVNFGRDASWDSGIPYIKSKGIEWSTADIAGCTFLDAGRRSEEDGCFWILVSSPKFPKPVGRVNPILIGELLCGSSKLGTAFAEPTTQSTSPKKKSKKAKDDTPSAEFIAIDEILSTFSSGQINYSWTSTTAADSDMSWIRYTGME